MWNGDGNCKNIEWIGIEKSELEVNQNEKEQGLELFEINLPPTNTLE